MPMPTEREFQHSTDPDFFVNSFAPGDLVRFLKDDIELEGKIQSIRNDRALVETRFGVLGTDLSELNYVTLVAVTG